MYKNSVVIGLMAISLCSLGHANLSQKLNHKKNNFIAKNYLAKKNTNDYTDFSGIWEGNCDGVDIDPIVIKNDDFNLYLDGEQFYIDAQKITSDSAKYFSSSNITAVNWDEDKTTLTIKDTWVMQTFGVYQYRSVTSQTMRFALNNGDLVITNIDESGNTSEQCIFKKK